MQEELEKIIEYLRGEFSKIRAGRASIDLVENIMVEAYNSQMPINQLATISSPEPRLIIIKPWDKSVLKSIESALRAALSDINPVVEGDIIRISFPAPTEERRRELVKELGNIVETSKVKIRKAREEALSELREKETKKEISEDELFKKREEAQKVIDDYNNKVQELGEKKEKEIMSI